MPNQLIGVSPPLVGKAQDSKVDLKKDFKEASPREYKNDFEKALKEKLALKEKAKDNEKETVASAESSPPKEVRLKKKDDDKESKVEEKEEKSSGGTKKKMTDQVDDQMISKFMASIESEIEIPESKTDLAGIKESQPLQNQVAIAAVLPQAAVEVPVESEAKPLQMDSLPKDLTDKIMAFQPQPKMADHSAMQLAAAEINGPTLIQGESIVAKEAEVKDTPVFNDEKFSSQMAFQPSLEAPIATAVLQPELLENLSPEAIVETASDFAPQDLEPVGSTAVSQLAIPLEIAPQIQPQAMAPPALELVATQALNVEQELGALVGFESEKNAEAPKVFESEKIGVTQKAQDFQKSVYDQLQKMDSRQPAAALQSNNAGSEKDQSPPREDLSQKGLKSESLTGTELHHAGQSHGEFKTQLAASPVASGSEQQRAQLLEQNHEKNIHEVMNQAQYLIKKGGGEMKVSMSPDGLAEVHMKVMLQDGKVNIEMNTQDRTVKKLIEESLSDLRSSLAAQHLTIDHVKINSVSATNTDNSAQFQSNWNGNGAEHKQREFWTQFQDSLSQNNSRRSGYGSNAKDSVQSTSSTSTEAPVNALRTYGGTKGSQVNRVA